jgi:hypothetical protein
MPTCAMPVDATITETVAIMNCFFMGPEIEVKVINSFQSENDK